MTNNTAGHAHNGPGNAPDAAVAELVSAVEVVIKTLDGEVPFGVAGTVLERMKAVREQVDQLTFAMLVPLAQMEASGELLHESGQKTLKAYLAHSWGIGNNEAKRLMELAQGLRNESLSETAAAIEDGALTVGEAASIASGVQRQVDTRDTGDNPDADLYRAKIEHDLANLKREKPATSVQTLDRAAHALGLKYNPNRPEKNEQAQFAERGAHVRSNFAGFSFEAWGPVSDGERMKAALASFMAPHGTAEKTNADADGSAFGGEVIPPGEAVTTRSARTYDAFISAMGFAHGHHGHTDFNFNASGAAPGADADFVGDTDGFASGSGSPAAEADSPASGSGGGCTEAPGTKAVINVTVPLSALLGLGFVFKNDTSTPGATTPGAAGATRSPRGSGAGAGPDPGGGAAATAGGTNTTEADADPPSTAPGYADAPVSSGLAVTEDGNVLALSAVRAMAPTAQIRRLIFDDRTGLPLDLGRAHRLAPGYLRSAAFMGHTTCAWDGGCDVPVSQCEADHITEFSHGGATTAANIQPLCSTHNRAKYRRTRTENTLTGGGAAAGTADTDNGATG